MIFHIHICVWFMAIICFTVALNVSNSDESDVTDFLNNLNEKSVNIASKLVTAQWDLENNSTEIVKQKLFEITTETIENARLRFHIIAENYPWTLYTNADIRRQLRLYSEIGILVLPLEEFEQFQKIISDVNLIQKETNICDYYNKTKCDLRLMPDIEDKLKNSQNSKELSYLWTEWRTATNPKLEHLLMDYIKLCNHAAVLNNYLNFQKYSLRNFESSNLKEDMISLWNTIKPLYSHIHAYVRRKLRNTFGEKIVPLKGSIPAYLLGNIWSENWSGISDKMLPFPKLDSINFTSVMTNKGYTSETIRQLAEDLLFSMNFSIPRHLWFNNTLGTSKTRETEKCSSKIYNFYKKDIRIIHCTEVSYKNYLAANHLLVKALYMLQYSHQPFVYQTTDPGLEEAIQNIVTMSASTFTHLKKIGLFNENISYENRLNRLFKLALEKIVAVPFFMVQEFWRWDVYNKELLKDTILELYDLRNKYQGISIFTKELSFDPGGTGSAFSILSLTHRFMSIFMEFQIYESLCNMSENFQNKTSSLDECDLSGNVKAGVALRNVMSRGSSKPLSENLQSLTNSNKISSESLLKYFEPLLDWLKKENEMSGEFIGWEDLNETAYKKTRRKRSLKFVPEGLNEDVNGPVPREKNRLQHLLDKRSKDNFDKELANGGHEEERNENLSPKDKNSKVSEGEKEIMNVGKQRKRSVYSKKRNIENNSDRKSLDPDMENMKRLPREENKEDESLQKLNKFTKRNKKRHFMPDSVKHMDSETSNKEVKFENKRDAFGADKKYESASSNQIDNRNNAEFINNNKMTRHARRAKKQKRFSIESLAQDHNIWVDKNKNQYELDRSTGEVKWHTDTKKDISRLLHSFGFAMENDDKDKIKDSKKKIKGDSNSDLKSNMAAKESSFESMVDYNRIKSVDGEGNAEEEKGNKLWSVKSYVTGNSRFPSLLRKDSIFDSSHTARAIIPPVLEEKFIGKKDTSLSRGSNVRPSKEVTDESDNTYSQSVDSSSLRHFEFPSVQILLKNGDLDQYSQKPIYTIIPAVSENKVRTEINKNIKPTKYGTLLNKNSGVSEAIQYKEKKEFREDPDKSPYIIILGQVSPNTKDHLVQEKNALVEKIDNKPSQLQSGGSSADEKIVSGKKGRALEKIFVVPIDIKNSQPNLMSRHYPEVQSKGNVENQQESMEEQIRFKGKEKLNENNDFYKTDKEGSSNFIISWNNDKSRRIARRSKREHVKDMEDNLKILRLEPVKESVLEDLLGKNFDRTSLNNKNVKILVHDGLLSGGPDYSSALVGGAIHNSVSVPIGEPQHQQSSLTQNVLSALSPKSYSQVAKASDQHQDMDLEEDLRERDVSPPVDKDKKEQELPFLVNPGLRCNALAGTKKVAKLFSDDDNKKVGDVDPSAKGDDACCKKIILTPCPPKCPPPCPFPSPLPSPPPSSPPPMSPTSSPCPPSESQASSSSPSTSQSGSKTECEACKKPSECSLVNCQFKITKAKKPHERLTIMIYDRINPPAELPEPYDDLAVISEILQRIQCCSTKPPCQLTEEDPDYPANDNMDQLKGNTNQQQEHKGKIQEIGGEMQILENDNSDEEEETDENIQNMQNSPNTADEDKYQPKEKATPAIDQLTVFNKDKLKPVFIELRKVDDMIKKRSHQG